MVIDYIIIGLIVGFALAAFDGDRNTERGELMFPEDKEK